MSQFWKSIKRRLLQRAKSNAQESTAVDVNYLNLEPRRVLNADFTLIGGALELDNFSETADENLSIDQLLQFYRFDLDEGVWSGVDTPFMAGNGTNTLLVDSNMLNEVSIGDSLGIGLDIEFSDVDLSELNSTSIVTSGSIGQDVFTALIAPTLDLTANEIDLTNSGNDFDSVELNATQSVSLFDVDGVEIIGADVGDKLEVRAAGIDLSGAISTDRMSLDSGLGVAQLASSSIVANEMVLTGEGDFLVDSSLNDINDVAADIDGNFELNVADGIDFASLNCNGTVYCGINVTGDMSVSSLVGDITQSADASIFVDGDAFFTTTDGDICLSGGDCDGDGANDNVVLGGLNFAASGDVVFAANSDIVIDSVSPGTNFRFSGQRIDLNTNVVAESLLLQATDGVNSNGNAIRVEELLLIGTGTFDVSSTANSIQNIASNISGSLLLGSSSDLNIGTLVHVSCFGNVEVCGLQVDGDANIELNNANLSQSAAATVSGTLTVDANGGDICLSGADCDGDGVSDNDFNVISIVGGNEVEIADSNGLTFARLEANRSAIIAGEAALGQITLDGNIQIVDQLLLQASDGVSQVSGTISTSELLLSGEGQFSLSDSANSIRSLAADVSGDLQVSARTDLLIDSLTYDSTCNTLSVVLCGLNVGGNLEIALSDSDLEQTANASLIVGGDAILTTTDGNICLPGGDCDGDGINDNQIDGSVSVSADGNVLIVENDDLVVDEAEGNGSFRFAGNNIQINTDIVGVDLLLQASDGVSLNGNIIDVSSLMVTGAGTFDLFNPANSIDNFAADVIGSIELANSSDLNIGSLTFVSSCADVVVCGVSVTDNLSITLNNADLSQTAAVVVTGLTTIDVGSGDVCLAFGDCDDDGLNDNDFHQINIVAASEIEIADTNDISVQGLGFSDNGAVTAGQITLDGDIVGGERLLLQANNGVNQISGSVSTNDLILDGNGDFHLCLNNSIGSTTTPGRISANVSGDAYVNNFFAVELIDQEFTTKSGTQVSHDQFNVGENLTVISDAANQIAIFDSTQINVAANASFVTTGENSDIVVDNLNVTGAIGVATVTGDARIVNQNANGITFRGDDIPVTDATEVCAHFESSTVNGDLFAQATNGDITNEADATLEVNGTATLVAGTTNLANVTGSNNEFNIKLGHQANDNISLDTLSASAAQASIQLDRSVEFSQTAIGTPTVDGADGGTLYLSVDGSVTQSEGILLSADNVAIVSSEHLFLDNIDADRVAFESTGFVDTSSLTDLPDDLPSNNSDALAPRHASVDAEYGIIVSSQNDLTVTTISDALDCQGDLTGISASNGHAFLQTTGDANIHFDGTQNTDTINANGMIFGMAADMQNGHVLTTVAGGDLTIEDNTVLRSTSGTVTDISAFTTDEGVDFTNVTKEGPLLSLFLPTPSDNPTTKTVNTDDTQFIGLNFGRAGEQHFIIEVDWADGTLDVLDFDTDIGNRFERISHTFTNEFLTETFELPTFLNLFNDPAINLFDNGGQINLNGGTNDLNTNDHFVLAFSDSRPQGDLSVASVSRPEAIIRESIIPANDDQLSSETEASDFGLTDTNVEEEVSDAYLVRLDDAGLEIKETRQELEKANVTQDVIAQWKQRIEEGTQFPPGQYRINWTESGVSFSIEFEKGAEEDLNLGELEPVRELESRADDSLEADEAKPENENRDDDASELGQGIPFPSVLPSNEIPETMTELREQRLNNEPEVMTEDVAVRSRAALIAAGALALGLKKRGADREKELAEELKKLAAAENKFSFSKSARQSRRIGG